VRAMAGTESLAQVRYRRTPRRDGFLRERRVFFPMFAITAAAAVLALVGLKAVERSGVGVAIDAQRSVLAGPAMFVVLAVILVAERLRPAVQRPLLARGHLIDGLYLALYAALVVPLIVLLSTGFMEVVRSLMPWLVLPKLPVPSWALALTTVVLVDFANWAIHLLNHTRMTLWRLHAVHHSQEEMSVLTAFRAHPLVHLTYVVAALPALVFASNSVVPPVVFTAYACWSAFTHANLRWTLGPFGRIIVSPAYHRLHHAATGRSDVNLGTILTAWDLLSKRAVFPRPGMAPVDTGIAGRPVPVEQGRTRYGLLSPFVAQVAEPFFSVHGSALGRTGELASDASA